MGCVSYTYPYLIMVDHDCYLHISRQDRLFGGCQRDLFCDMVISVKMKKHKATYGVGGYPESDGRLCDGRYGDDRTERV